MTAEAVVLIVAYATTGHATASAVGPPVGYPKRAAIMAAIALAWPVVAFTVGACIVAGWLLESDR